MLDIVGTKRWGDVKSFLHCASIIFKDCPGRGANPGSFYFVNFVEQKQRFATAPLYSSPLFYDPQIGEIGHGQKLISSHFVTRFVARIFNKVPSDVNTSLDGSTYPKNTWVVLAC